MSSTVLVTNVTDKSSVISSVDRPSSRPDLVTGFVGVSVVRSGRVIRDLNVLGQKVEWSTVGGGLSTRPFNGSSAGGITASPQSKEYSHWRYWVVVLAVFGDIGGLEGSDNRAIDSPNGLVLGPLEGVGVVISSDVKRNSLVKASVVVTSDSLAKVVGGDLVFEARDPLKVNFVTRVGLQKEVGNDSSSQGNLG